MSWQTPENLSADGIRATVTGTPGSAKPIVDDNAGGLEWGAVPQAALSSGNKLGLAAGGTNADLSATGGATHVLRQASAGAAVTVGALGLSDLPFTGTANNNSFARGDGTWTNGVSSGGWTAGFFGGASSATAVVVRNYTNDASDTLSAQITGGGAALASAGSSQTRGAGFIAHGNESSGNTGNAYVLLGAVVGSTFRVYDEDGTNIFQVTKTGTSVSALAASGRITTSSSSGVTANLFRNYSGTTLAAYVDTADGADNGNLTLGSGVAIAPGSSQTRGAAIELAGNEHATRPGELGLCAGVNGSVRGYDASTVLRFVIGTTGVIARGTGTSIPTGGAWTTVRTIASNQQRFSVVVAAFGSIDLDWDGTTLTGKNASANLLVAASAGATEIAFRVSGSNLQASNGTGTSRDALAAFALYLG